MVCLTGVQLLAFQRVAVEYLTCFISVMNLDINARGFVSLMRPTMPTGINRSI